MLRFDDDRRVLELGVHDLLEAGPPSGHLALQAAWSARARMRAGQEAHSGWQAGRAALDPDFAREVVIRHRMVVAGWEVVLSGRVDGLTRRGGETLVEEVKSTALPGERLRGVGAEAFPAWTRQLQLYLLFLGAAGTVARGRLVVLSLVDGHEQAWELGPDPELADWLEAQLRWILEQHESRRAWLARRRAARVPFAHPDFRPGQEALAAEVALAVQQGRHLLLTAPTGYGKTAAALYGALQVAWATDRRVFFATARTTQQRMAEEDLAAMAGAGLPLRAVSLRAREKMCCNEVVACRPDACRFAFAYHDKVREGRLPERAWGAEGAALVPDAVTALAVPAEACPFALSLDLVANADVVVGDYNYVFDPAVRLSPLVDDPGEWIVVVDEAHNLPDRAMGYLSPSLSLSMVQAAVDALEGDPRYRAVARVAADIAAWLEESAEPVREAGGELALPLDEGLRPRELRRLAEDVDAVALDYVLLKHERALFDPGGVDPWLETARAVLRLRAALDRAGEETVVLGRVEGRARPAPRRGQLTLLGTVDPPARRGEEVQLSLLCRDPSGLLGTLFGSLAASVLMSATLEPPEFYAQLCGLAEARRRVARHPSPFPPEHRRVLVLPQVSTAYRDRARDRAATAALVSAAVGAVPGNTAVFFSSFALRDDLLPLLDLGPRPVLLQDRRMDEAARAAVLATLGRGEGHVLLGVLGGIFAEGVDLPGAALRAVIVVGPALPMANLERRLLQEWYEARYGEGERYAWLVPAMCRVVQAAGRVIRGPEDRGAVVLIDQRFLRHDLQAFFPVDWRPERTRDPALALTGFWQD